VPSEIVVIFFEEEVRWLPAGLTGGLREMHKIREFRLSYCLETIERIMAPNQQALTRTTHAEVCKGYFDFLSRPLVVFSHTLVKYNRFRNL